MKEVLKMAVEAVGFLVAVGLVVFCLGVYGISEGSNDKLTRGTIEFLKIFE